jgi:hypothetical protein
MLAWLGCLPMKDVEWSRSSRNEAEGGIDKRGR